MFHGRREGPPWNAPLVLFCEKMGKRKKETVHTARRDIKRSQNVRKEQYREKQHITAAHNRAAHNRAAHNSRTQQQWLFSQDLLPREKFGSLAYDDST